MGTSSKFTSADLLLMPDDGKRYEVIDGELHVAKQPSYHHQYACGRLLRFLDEWNDRALGIAITAPGLIFAEDDDVAPDLVWVSRQRARHVFGEDGKLHSAPDLVIEVLSPGPTNEQRDRQAKLKLYSRRGVQEYWIIDWQKQQAEIYRRSGGELALIKTIYREETLDSPLLPGFSCKIAALLLSIP